MNEQKRTHVIACADAWLRGAGQPTYTELLTRTEAMNKETVNAFDSASLSTLEGLARDAKKWDLNTVEGISPTVALALIALARAGQQAGQQAGDAVGVMPPLPEPIMGLWSERMQKAWTDSMREYGEACARAAWDNCASMNQPLIADLRAQLASAQRGALEQAAKIADEHYYGPCGEHDYSYNDASAKADDRAEQIAKAIRYAARAQLTNTTGED